MCWTSSEEIVCVVLMRPESSWATFCGAVLSCSGLCLADLWQAVLCRPAQGYLKAFRGSPGNFSSSCLLSEQVSELKSYIQVCAGSCLPLQTGMKQALHALPTAQASQVTLPVLAHASMSWHQSHVRMPS